MRTGAILIAVAGLALSATGWYAANASDHDDGVSDLKSQDVNLTDLYVFREDSQTGSAADSDKLVFIMNSNPRSLPGEQYFFSTQANYTFHVTQVLSANTAAAPTGEDDLDLQFTFAAPDSAGHQAITYTLIQGTVANPSIAAGTTSTLAEAQACNAGVGSCGGTSLGQTFTDGTDTLKVSAGLWEDPFFFDVEAFFKFRQSLLDGALSGTVPISLFSTTSGAADFTHGYNVNSIIVEVPIDYLQSDAGETTFDVWETTSVPNPDTQSASGN
jgi:hypothetical protein